MTTPAQPNFMTEQPDGDFHKNRAYDFENNNAFYSVQPNNPALAGQAYSPAAAGQPYNPELVGQPYNPAVAGQPYNPSRGQLAKPLVTVVTQARKPAPKSNCGYSICACVYCFWPLGIMAIAFSCKSEQAIEDGDMDTARIYGKRAWIAATMSLVCGVATVLIVLLYLAIYNSIY